MNGIITGCTFFDIPMDVWDKLKVGTILELRRDIKNPYDKNAIKVIFEDKQIGWVDKNNAIKLAPAMDQGTVARAVITRVFGSPKDRPHIEVEYQMGGYI